MLTAFAEFWTWPDTVETTSAPQPKPRPQPVLIGDILTTRGGEPELLRRWREDSDRDAD
ncbi:MAG: hypothetical protein QNJ44_16075 [Rhodobacter sp.]|nr:hypothetical protein [Rhodobacter sp.]